MNYAVLSEELSTDPLGRNYATMTDEEVAASLAAEDRTRLRPIQSSELLAWAADGNRLARLETAAADAGLGAVQSVAKAAILMIRRDGTTLDLSLNDRANMLAALVAADVLTQADSDSLVAIGTETLSRAEELGLGTVRIGSVHQARI